MLISLSPSDLNPGEFKAIRTGVGFNSHCIPQSLNMSEFLSGDLVSTGRFAHDRSMCKINVITMRCVNVIILLVCERGSSPSVTMRDSEN